jgi:SAM-dependent methyltransferase
MASAQQHYESHLAPLYTWMAGGADAPRQRFAALLADLGLKPSRSGATALDLGAGSGFQTLPLAATGFAVTAVDFSDALLDELARDAATAGLAAQIKLTGGDLREVARHCPTPPPEVVVCMGDTLTHLATLDDVTRLFSAVATALAVGGHFLLSFRDYTTPRSGPDRFIPVRSDRDRLFTCFLEFGPTHVTVHDLVHTRTQVGDDASSGEWRFAASAYEKLRLDPAWVREQLAAAGFALVRDTAQNGLVTLVARRALSS